MGIGGALAEARSEAGMTVDQVSDRTRIRSTIIRAIERDDYAVCGGDFYARGHIRAIAHVVGTDPVPLIEQYDIAHSPPPPPPDEATAHRTSGLWLHTLEREPARGGQLAANGAASAARQTANGPDNGWVRPAGITAAEAFRPVMPLRLQGTRRVPVRRAVVSLIVLAVVAVLAYLLAAGGGAPVPARSHHPPARGPQHSAASRRSPAAAAPAPAPTLLPAASAVAFGPAGQSQGDNPAMAQFAVDGNNATGWQSDWYATATFNGSQPGTGLLLDMGASVTVSSVRVLLGPAPGGTVQLRAGNTPSLGALPVVAQTTNPGGTLTLQPAAPVTARYVLVWFTQLPPDSTGTYQADVYNVSVSGAG